MQFASILDKRGQAPFLVATSGLDHISHSPCPTGMKAVEVSTGTKVKIKLLCRNCTILITSSVE